MLRINDMKRNITIGFDAHYANTDVDMLGAYSRFMIESLAIAAPRYSYIRAYMPKCKQHDDYNRIEQLHNIESMEPDGYFARLLWPLWRAWRVAADAENGDVELYHGFAELMPLTLSTRNIRSVATIHDLSFFHDKHFFNIPENFVRRLVMGWTLHRVDRVIALSESLRDDAIKHFNIDPDKVDVIHCGASKLFGVAPSQEQCEDVVARYSLPEKYLLSVGAHIKRRNHLQVIRLLPMLDADLHYVIVGNTTGHTQNMLRVARELGVVNRVHIISSYSAEDLPIIYNKALLLVQLSSYEGFALSLIEAMASGLPIVASNNEHHKSVAGTCAYYVDSANRDALLQAIRKCVSDEQWRIDAVNGRRMQVMHYRHEVAGYNLLNCYRRLDVNIRG
jgi:glycosyltransferase involved in cell wall biosynthesis